MTEEHLPVKTLLNYCSEIYM